MEIVHLIDNKEFINEVAGWLYKEFVQNIRNDIDLDYVIRALHNRRKDSTPITLIAVEDNICLGTITLFQNDLKTMQLTPWLGALYVKDIYRARGIAEKLMNELELLTKKLGFKDLYLRTEHTAAYYRKLGWKYICKTKDELGIDTEVFKKEL
ncbi:GNAT family N-acetyltransferase [Clostridium sp. CF012]|uniref:GNAT family N-acetyltransferase n=1 Tax=Clostridium sp. CF012 TaxID=2843319 RepID=UPI001C0C1460|nr:GNAT family N-acetyltransferase [Clostridium sp. CF012]MBU3143814.1 GNAT family N-acetyltransferase [Clostridium sp. CF012]